MGNQLNMKIIRSALLVLTIAMSMQSTEAKMLWLDPIQLIKEFSEVVILVKDLEKEHAGKHHHRRPLVQSVFGDIWNNIMAFINEPSFATFSAVYIDWSSYILMPLEGGWQAPESHSKYIEDPRSYNNAGVTEDYLFKQSTSIFKEKYWQFFGLFSRITEEQIAANAPAE